MLIYKTGLSTQINGIIIKIYPHHIIYNRHIVVLFYNIQRKEIVHAL
jgi:hypothetical protein